MLAGLVSPGSGALRSGGRDVERLPSAVTGRRIAYVGANAYHFVGSLRDNLLYGLKHRPLRPPASEQALSPAALAEARRAGNPEFDIHADWVDYAAAGATGADDITEHLIEMLAVVERSEEHTSELQSIMRISYAVFCLKKKQMTTHTTPDISKQTNI